ncbi:MAG: protein-methionine-sulfoxide reductase heme-binding subunit MsrQ [Sulfuritalea sp.]|nr:protein-methionine-sulfoxide reductase heme-binding subunit MsrQ [Sulfuritalea sp.]MDP1983949.1 protein-methionine-sulfoxide reductase heme-binding subunit MsrQ [Sulfuritalea sp.]
MNPALLKPPLFLACLVPLAYYAWGAQADTLDGEAVEALRRGLGIWALNFLLLTLAVTPLRKYTGSPWLGRLRRMLGLFVFFYATLHLATYLWLDQSFDWPAIAQDIVKRPFIVVGLIAFLLLLPLALTSNAFALRTLGGRRWQELHRNVYLIGLLAVLHYAWMAEADAGRPLLYALLLAILLGLRIWWRVEELRRQRAGGLKPRRRIIPISVRK